MDIVVDVDGSEELLLTVYIDLASGEALELLVRDEAPFTLPEGLADTYLGTGLSGDIHGWVGHSTRLGIGSFQLRGVPTAFAPAAVRSKQEGADGVLGNDALRRFNAVFDYSQGLLLLKPNKHYAVPFE